MWRWGYGLGGDLAPPESDCRNGGYERRRRLCERFHPSQSPLLERTGLWRYRDRVLQHLPAATQNRESDWSERGSGRVLESQTSEAARRSRDPKSTPLNSN